MWQHQLYSVIGIITDVRLNLLCFGRSADPLDDGRRNCHTYTRPCAKISWDHHAPLWQSVTVHSKKLGNSIHCWFRKTLQVCIVWLVMRQDGAKVKYDTWCSLRKIISERAVGTNIPLHHTHTTTIEIEECQPSNLTVQRYSNLSLQSFL